MIAPLLILVAHGLDGLTLLMAVELYPFDGNEFGWGAQVMYGMAGLGGVLLLKAGGAAMAAAIVARARRWRTGLLLFASAAGDGRSGRESYRGMDRMNEVESTLPEYRCVFRHMGRRCNQAPSAKIHSGFGRPTHQWRPPPEFDQSKSLLMPTPVRDAE